MLKPLKETQLIFRAYLKTLWYLFKIDAFHSSLWILSTILVALLPVSQIYVLSRFIDSAVSQSAQSISWAISWLVLFGLKNVLDKAFDYFNFHVMMNFGREFDNIVTRKFAYLDMEYYEDPKIASLIEKVRVAYAGEPLTFVNSSFKSLTQLIRMVGALYFVILYEPIFILFILVATIPQFVNSIIFGKNLWFIWSAKEELKKNYTATRKYLNDYKALPEVAVFGIREFLLAQLKDLHHQFQLEQRKHTYKRFVVGLSLDVLKLLGIGVPFGYLSYGLIQQRISLGAFNLYFGSLNQLLVSTEEFFYNLANAHNSGLFVWDVMCFLDLPEKIKEGAAQIKKSALPPSIELKNIAFSYPLTQKTVLENFSIKIKPGEHVAIVGENGAGKTTLIKLLLRFYDVNAGQVLIDGYDIKELNRESWYKNVGTLFQNFNNYHYAAATNISLGNISRPVDLEMVRLAAKMSGADNFISELPKGYDQMLSRVFEGGTDLSGGQWQKMAIARVFYRNPNVIILDEPTSAIDPKSEADIFNEIFEFAQGKTVIIVSHRFSTVRKASRILVMSHGKIVEDGTHDMLMGIESGIYKSAFEIQRKGYE